MSELSFEKKSFIFFMKFNVYLFLNQTVVILYQ